MQASSVRQESRWRVRRSDEASRPSASRFDAATFFLSAPGFRKDVFKTRHLCRSICQPLMRCVRYPKEMRLGRTGWHSNCVNQRYRPVPGHRAAAPQWPAICFWSARIGLQVAGCDLSWRGAPLTDRNWHNSPAPSETKERVSGARAAGNGDGSSWEVSRWVTSHPRVDEPHRRARCDGVTSDQRGGVL